MIFKAIRFARKLYIKYFEDDIMAFSSQLAYNFLLASFPFLIFIFTLLSNFGLKKDSLLSLLKNVLPSNAYVLVTDTLYETMKQKHNTLMSITLLLALWTASIGFNAVVRGINRAYNLKETRPFIKRQITNIVNTLILALSIVLTMMILILIRMENTALIKSTGYSELFDFLWQVLKYGIIGSFLIFIFAAVYRYAPSVRLSWKQVLPGAIFTVMVWLPVSVVFSFYANNYARYSDLYGSLTAVIVLMIWMFVSSNIILIGGEINSILNQKNLKKR